MYQGLNHYVPKAEEQYLNMLRDTVDFGIDIFNARTGKNVRTLPGTHMLTCDVAAGDVSLITSRRLPHRSATAELLGYLKGVTDSSEMEKLGTPTWHANANENDSWLNSPFRTGPNDMGKVYGYWLHNWPSSTRGTVNQLRKVYENLLAGKDDRGEILMMLNPGEVDTGCLRPCMYSHTFQLINGTLNLTSVQRSNDGPLGGAFNIYQCFVLLLIMARITGNTPGRFYHVNTNFHVYEDQIEIFNMEHRNRTPGPTPTVELAEHIQTLDDVLYRMTADDIIVTNYEPQTAIKYPFSV